ncbi:MAG: xanthine dehydrogenase accessory protein XdhC [Pseudomonadota bacterium]
MTEPADMRTDSPLDVALAALRLREADGAAALITVCGAKGSTPREAGAKLVVSPTRQVGTVGGGNLEYQAIEQARRLLELGEDRFLIQDYPLGPFLGQCCGGHVRLLIESLSAASAEVWRAAGAMAGAGDVAHVETVLGEDGRFEKRLTSGPGVGASLSSDPISLLDKSGADAVRGPAADCARLVERFAPARPALALFGAGHVGRRIAHMLGVLPFDAVWLDDRPEEFARGPDAALPRRPIGDPDEAVAAFPKGAYYLILTHAHDLDYRLLRAVMGRGDFAYCGLIGSATKRARFLSRLRKDGVPESAIGRLICPIGAGGPKSKAPAAIAAGVASELMVAWERGGASVAAPSPASSDQDMEKTVYGR